jgi:hypothetical protein
LASLARKPEELEAMERDSGLILGSYATLAPEALDSFSPKERRRVYVILNLTVEALVDDSLKISGAFGEEPPVWESDRTSRRSPSSATLLPNKVFGFDLVLREDAPSETSFRVLGGASEYQEELKRPEP